ncbi:MAG: Bax inhibitor-1/YccA family protein [Micromonosporaceae bacterium]
MRSSNFVLGGMTQRAAQGTATAPYGAAGQPGYGQPGGYPPAAPPQAGRAMTIDDVVVRTIGLLAVTGVVAALSWMLLPPATHGIALIGSAITGLVLVLAISFMQITNPFVIGAYAVVEGVFLGVVSSFFEGLFPGIVLQAVVGTFGVFALMAVLYKSRVIRATPFVRKAIIGALVGAVALILVNFVFSMFSTDLGLFNDPTDGQSASWLQWVIGIALVVIAAVSFILDFDMVEQGVRHGLDQKYAWLASFGILVGLIFLYLQLLRLLAMFRE